ncbi:MAG: hypothetical protein JWM47_4103, partial [Acidimicrobiales bacterium]|nr:hypothetical protein [Acidimicrobiales bacterium]
MIARVLVEYGALGGPRLLPRNRLLATVGLSRKPGLPAPHAAPTLVGLRGCGAGP